MLRNTYGLGASFRLAITKKTIRFVAFSFVDDTDQIQTNEQGLDWEEVVRDLQRGVNTWEGGLRATGGAIVPQKCFWYLIDHKWTDGKPELATIQKRPAILTVKDRFGV